MSMLDNGTERKSSLRMSHDVKSIARDNLTAGVTMNPSFKQDSDLIRSSNAPSPGVWGNQQLQKQSSSVSQSYGSVNFHKKLKDEFDRYERLKKEQLLFDGDYIGSSPQYGGGKDPKNPHLRQLIAIQYMNINL